MKDLQALPIKIPSNVAEKKSFTIKPPQECSGSGTIGILFLELIIQTWMKPYSHSHPRWSQTRIWGLHSLASWTLFSFSLQHLPQIAAGAQVDFGPDLCDQGDQWIWGCQNQQEGRCNHICPSSWGLGATVWAGREAGGLEVDSCIVLAGSPGIWSHKNIIWPNQLQNHPSDLGCPGWPILKFCEIIFLACREASWLEVHSLTVLGCLG